MLGESKEVFEKIMELRHERRLAGRYHPAAPNKTKAKPQSLRSGTYGGTRCDLCLLYVKNNEGGKADRLLFHEMDWRCYHHEGEQHRDHAKTVCPGCGGICSKTIECLANKGYEHCGQCDYRHGKTHRCLCLGKCNLGMTAEEIIRVAIL